METPTLNTEYRELDSLLQELHKSHEESLFFWHVALTDAQNALLIGDLERAHNHIADMYDTVSDFRVNILKAECELNKIETSR